MRTTLAVIIASLTGTVHAVDLYDIPGVKGGEVKPVSLPKDSVRGGLDTGNFSSSTGPLKGLELA